MCSRPGWQRPEVPPKSLCGIQPIIEEPASDSMGSIGTEWYDSVSDRALKRS